MTGRTHDLAAFTALSAVIVLNPPAGLSLSTVLLALFMNQIGGVIPDIDQPTAPFWRNLPIGSVFGKVFSRLSGGHRFITHSLLGLFLFGFGVRSLLAVVQPLLGSIDTGFVWWAFMIGMVSHLIMDAFTKEGVPLFLPFPVKVGFPPVKALRITTGKKIELFIIFPALVLICIYIFGTYYESFVRLLQTTQ